jgi:pentatricopeptide repeat protein
MMDIYALSGNVAKAHSIFTSTAPDAVSYGLLIKAYSRHGNMLEATKVVHQLLADPNVSPSVNIFTVLVEGWAVSTRPDAVDQAFAVLRLLREHHRCVELNIRPNNFFFTSLLKCLAASKASNAGERAEALLDEMDREAERSSGKDDYFHRPDCVTLSLAIKTCFEAGDLTRAESIMKRMETSDTPPNTRTYNSILQYYAQLGTSAAAQRTEHIISYMKELSQTTKATVEPNAISYNIVLAAWARSGDADATERMWTVYQQMQTESISPSMASYNTLVSFFAKSGGKETLARADQVLQDMVQRNHAEFRPDFRHFNPVINAFLHSNDASSATATLVRYIEGYLCDSHECSKPNRSYFSRVTKAWIQTGDLVRATVFLDKIQELHDALHLPEGPCRESYRALVAAWDTSDHPRKSEYTARLETKLSSFARALE